MLLASCNACRMWLRKQFFTYEKDDSVSNIKKQNRRFDKYVRRFTSLFFFPSAVTSIQCVCYFYEENKSSSSVSELWYRMFTEKNFSGDHLPSTLDASLLHLRRTLIFFLNSITSFIKNKKYNIEKNFLFA